MDRNRSQRGSALIIAIIVMLIIAVIGVGLLRFTQRSVAFAIGGPRHKATVSCAQAARALLESKFHLLGKDPTEIGVLNETVGSQMRALGGHIDSDPTQPLVFVKQVEVMPPNVVAAMDASSGDVTNIIGGLRMGGGQPLKVTVHCQEGLVDPSRPFTSGRQVEIEYGIRFGL